MKLKAGALGEGSHIGQDVVVVGCTTRYKAQDSCLEVTQVGGGLKRRNKEALMIWSMYIAFKKYSDPLTLPHFDTLQPYSKMVLKNKQSQQYTMPHTDKANRVFFLN